MKKLFKRLETEFTAVAFAEAGEFETARQILKENEQRNTNRPTSYKRPTERKVLRAE